MATDIREEIDKAIEAVLKTNPAIQKVTREFVGFDLDSGAIEGISYLDMPAVIVNTGNESNSTQGPVGNNTRITYSPEIVGYVYDEDEYFTDLNKLIANVKKTLFTQANRRYFYNGSPIGFLHSYTTLSTDRGRLAPYAAFSMTLEILADYTTSTGGELS